MTLSERLHSLRDVMAVARAIAAAADQRDREAHLAHSRGLLPNVPWEQLLRDMQDETP